MMMTKNEAEPPAIHNGDAQDSILPAMSETMPSITHPYPTQRHTRARVWPSDGGGARAPASSHRHLVSGLTGYAASTGANGAGDQPSTSSWLSLATRSNASPACLLRYW